MGDRISYPSESAPSRTPLIAIHDVDVTEIIEIVAKQLDVASDGVSSASRLVEDLGAPPLALAQMILALEERFEIFIPDDDISKLVTVRDVVRYVEELVRPAPVQ